MTMGTDSVARGTAAAPARAELAISGMTCASCAARVERKLNRLDGVTASVNFATETASVAYDPARLGPGQLVATVLAMVPAAQFRYWQWLSLVLAAPVAGWGAWPFHRAAAVNARHGAATMDTL